MFSNFSFVGQSLNGNIITIVSKGYHYTINHGIVSNFYFSTDPVYPGSLRKTYCSGWPQGNLGSAWILKPIVQDEFWQGIIGTASINFFCFIFTIPVYFIHSTIKSPSITFFHFPHFHFPYNFVVLQKVAP